MLDREIFLSGPRVDNAEKLHDVGSVDCVLSDWSQFGGTAPLAGLKVLGQLIATRVSVELILGSVDL